MACPQLFSSGVAGVDEVGRGPLAGPVVAAAVVLTPAFENTWMRRWLRDSKKLSPTVRTILARGLCRAARSPSPLLWYGLGQARAAEIDARGLTHATFLAMHRAMCQLHRPVRFVLIDGNLLPRPPLAAHMCALTKGDTFVPTIQAASVLAKVVRDRMMAHLAHRYPGYGFETHKGYGTPQHMSALARLGPTSQHRFSFKQVGDVAA